MAMKFQDSEEDSIVAEINITPLTDIFLVLLIIFMISSSAIFEGGLQVKLPSAKGAKITDMKDGRPTYITIASGGKISINDRVIEEESLLKQVLEESLINSPNKVVIIRGDESIFLGKAVQIMDAARSAGAEKIALATKGGK